MQTNNEALVQLRLSYPFMFSVDVHIMEPNRSKSERVPLYKNDRNRTEYALRTQQSICDYIVTSERNEYEMHTNILSALNSITVGVLATTSGDAAQLLQL